MHNAGMRVLIIALTMLTISVIGACGRGDESAISVTLTEKSAIQQAAELQKKIEEENRISNSLLQEQLARTGRAQKIGNEFGIMYAPSSRSGYRSPNLPLFSSSLTLDDFPKTAAAAIKNAYPECVFKSFESLNLGCIYTAFILNRLSPDNKLMMAFAVAENRKVKIVLALGYSYVDSGAVAVDITTDNASIAAFLLGNGGVKNN